MTIREETQQMHESLSAELNTLLSERVATGRYATEDDAIRQGLEALAHEEYEDDRTAAAIEYFEQGGQGIPSRDVFDATRQAVDHT